MVLIVFALALLTSASLLLVDQVTFEIKRSSDAEQQQSAFEAAESGLDDYIAKLTQDQLFYLHYVHPAESPRTDQATAATVTGTATCDDPVDRPDPTAWPHGIAWNYVNGQTRWCSLGNGYEYNIQINPPSASQTGIEIVSTGRSITDSSDLRVVEAVVKRSSIADFQMLANVSITYGSDATTNGKIYSTHNITHNGDATGDVYAENVLSGSVSFSGGAKGYDGSSSTSAYPDLGTVIKDHPIDFQTFLASFADITNAAASGGIELDDPSKDAWWLTFNSNGTVSIKSCMRVSGNNIEDTQPSCTTPTTSPVPNNGAIHAWQSVIVSGQVNGRVTVASEADIVVAADISYVQLADDVLGLEAKRAMYVAAWVPTNLNWRAATLTQSGRWESAGPNGSKGTMVFTGSTATADGGQMSMFDTRVYNYDQSLLYLPPPWFPTMTASYEYTSFRELPAA